MVYRSWLSLLKNLPAPPKLDAIQVCRPDERLIRVEHVDTERLHHCCEVGMTLPPSQLRDTSVIPRSSAADRDVALSIRRDVSQCFYVGVAQLEFRRRGWFEGLRNLLL